MRNVLPLISLTRESFPLAGGTRYTAGGFELNELEQQRDFLLGMRGILVERRARTHSSILQLEDHQLQAVEEASQIPPAGIYSGRVN